MADESGEVVRIQHSGDWFEQVKRSPEHRDLPKARRQSEARIGVRTCLAATQDIFGCTLVPLEVLGYELTLSVAGHFRALDLAGRSQEVPLNCSEDASALRYQDDLAICTHATDGTQDAATATLEGVLS